MRDKPYPGMGNVSKTEGLYLQKEEKEEKDDNYDTAVFSRKTPFAGIPIKLVKKEPDIINMAKYLYVVYDSCADNKAHFTFTSQKKVGRIMNRNTNTISRLTQILKETGWITIIRMGLGRTNIIILHQFKNEVITEKEKENYKAETKRKIREFRYYH